MRNLIATLVLILFVTSNVDLAFASQIKKQIKGSDTPQEMTQAELNELNDPIFRFFLKNNSDQVSLEKIEQALQPDAAKRSLFVVDERIIDPTRPQSRRAVISFEGFRQGVSLKGNAMLSVIFTDTAFRDDAFIEGWGWDEDSGRYNYYRMDNGSWKFRGSSNDKSLFGQEGTCFQCHLNGAPIMKELLIPWNHWHSRSSKISYFDQLQPSNKRWPIASNSRFDNLKGAAALDSMVRSSIANFNSVRIKSSLKNGSINDAKTLLKHLFVTTEFNMISALQKSNLHPLKAQPAPQPSQPVAIPNSFFLNSAIIGGGGFSGFQGLGIDEANSFQSTPLRVQPAEYKTLVQEASLKIANQAGDADFSWLVPEPSDIDNHMIEKLMSEFVVPAHFVAAVMTIDLKNPVLSEKRASLLEFIPAAFTVSSAGASGNRFNLDWFKSHDLTKKTIAKLEAEDLSGNQSAQDFLAILKMTKGKTPLEELQSKVQAYASDINSKLIGANRANELKTLFEKAISIRKKVLDDDLLGSLDETEGKLLFPHK